MTDDPIPTVTLGSFRKALKKNLPPNPDPESLESLELLHCILGMAVMMTEQPRSVKDLSGPPAILASTIRLDALRELLKGGDGMPSWVDEVLLHAWVLDNLNSIQKEQ